MNVYRGYPDKELFNKYLIIEGHSRMTIYGNNPGKLNGTHAYNWIYNK